MTDLQRLATALTGRYRIEREVGAGGMATVYLARDVKHDRQVALKVLRAELSAILGAERFLNEIRVTANLQHPHILPLFDSGNAEGLLFYVMPYVTGETLRRRIDREKQLPIDEAVRITREVAGALDYAHRQGVIHRDIKPENVLLQDGTALVTDFGIALAVSKAGGTRLTETGLSLGTPSYMSPEQATGDRALDARTDVYSLGAVLYEMLTGDPPHTGSTSQAVIAAVMTEEPRDVASRRPRVAPHVAEAVHKALEKMPADRFPSAAEFARALEGPPVSGARTPARPIQRRPWQRWMPAAVGAAGLLVGLAVGPVLFPARPLREVRTRLTFSGNASAPVVTRDSRWLAYIRGACGSGGGFCVGDVVVQELPRGVPSALVSAATDLTVGGWSPDGSKLLVFMRPASGQRGLYVIPREGGVARKVAGDALIYAFASDRAVAFARRGAQAILLAQVATGEVSDSIVLGDGRWIITSVDFNPLNGFICFSGIHGSSFFQGIADGRGKILDSLRGPGGGAWYPDGRHVLAYQLAAQSVGTIVRMDVSSSGHMGRTVELLANVRQDDFTGFAPTAKGLVMGAGGRTADIWHFTVEGAARRLTHGSTWYYGPAIAPDGKTVAYVKQDAWGANLYTVSAAGGPERAITADSGLRQVVRWLPDQRRLSDIALAGAGTGRITQEIAEPETGRLHAVPLEPGLVIVAWRPDGSALAGQIDGRAFVIVDSSGTTIRRVAIPDSLGSVSNLALAPDGRAVALLPGRQPADRVYILGLDDGKLRSLAPVAASDSVRVRLQRWAPDGFLYLAMTVGAAPTALWRLPVRGGPQQRFATLPVPCDEASITLAQDARSGACIVNDDRPDLWLIERK